jgi:branched-chain amino acid transport system substrate-binding protein
MRKRLLVSLVALLLGINASVIAACGGSAGSGNTGEATEATAAGTEAATPAAEGEPIRIVFNAGISGSEVYDSALAKKGIITALRMLGYQVAGRSLEFIEVDNTSDPLVAVEKTRELVQTDTNDDGKSDRDPVDFICGPLSSASAAGVTYFLGQRVEKREKIPQCSVTAQLKENLQTAAELGFVPDGIYSSHGYYLGLYAADVLMLKTANCIHYEDQIAKSLQIGFERGFTEGGGTITSVTYVPEGTTEFADYFAALQPADCTMFWVRGKGAIQFVRQYNSAGLTATLLVPMSSNYSESQLEYLDALGLGVGIIAGDVYSPMITNAQNDEFIAVYQELYPGEYPTPETYGGWQAVMLFAEGVKTLNGDTSDPAKVIEAMKTLSMDTPTGTVTMSKYSKGFVGTRDFYILRSENVGGSRIAWVPVRTYSQVLLGE